MATVVDVPLERLPVLEAPAALRDGPLVPRVGTAPFPMVGLAAPLPVVAK